MNKTRGTIDAFNDSHLVCRIENDIYRGILSPGMWLKQIDLEERYGCTRIALRYALEQLASTKLIEKTPNRGFHVRRFSADYVEMVNDAKVRTEMSIADDLAQS